MREQYQGPLSPFDQPEVSSAYDSCRNEAEEGARLEKLRQELLEYLQSKSIVVLFSKGSTKSSESIKQKLANPQRPDVPIGDLYALQVVVDSSAVLKTVKRIKERWTMPKEFPWGLKTVRNGQSPLSHPDYKAVHMNIVFETDKIAEIKLFTPEQFEIEKQTRSYFEANRRLNA